MFGWLKTRRQRTAVPVNGPRGQSDQLLQDGHALLASGDLCGAELCYRQALAATPEHHLARVHLGSVLLQQQRFGDAWTELSAAQTLDPNHADCHHMLGGLSERAHDYTRAAFHFQRAFELKPDLQLACLGACRVLSHLGQITSARHLIAAGLAVNPTSADLHFYEGMLHFANDAIDCAIESYREALALGADHSALHGFVGGLLLKRNDIGGALVHLQRAIELNPENTEAHHDIGVVFTRLGQVEQAIQHQEITIKQDPSQLQAYSCLLFALGSCVDCTPQRFMQAAKRYADQVRKTVRPMQPLTTQAPIAMDTAIRSLRVGWVSGDFRKHVNLSFLKHVLVGLANESTELIAFSNNPYDDGATHELRRLMTHWHDIKEMSDHEAAELIMSCRVDILVDLAGHTAHNRLPVFAWRPAPVQVSWLGFFASTGLTEIDYLLADPLSVPAHWHSHFSERVWYLPETRLCMSPPDLPDALEVVQPPVLRTGFIMFGCFQVLSKINDSVLKTWARVMSGVPNSRLRLQIRYLELPGVRDTLISRMVRAGISSDRVELHGGVPVAEYLVAHNDVDIILDTFPYPGGTTTAEALWMGVPTVTLKGNSLLARQGASMLHNVGLPDWIAVNREDYVAKAIHFASDTAELANLRTRLRQQALASPLFDSNRFTAHFLAALRAMHQQRGVSLRVTPHVGRR
jgi:predicted O-linked N-acetylglucosamine transferase (SPINDLY family)